MAHYVIGDIQGCYRELIELTGKIGFNPSVDTLYLVGDLVNRGPESLKVLQWVYRYQDSIVSVLGNHDLYLLARFAQALPPSPDETIYAILNPVNAQENNKLIDYLRRCPLIFYDEKHLLVHAGIHPALSLAQLSILNQQIMQQLQADNYGEFIHLMYGDKPTSWHDDLSLLKQMKFMINSCTRMRFLHKKTAALNYKNKMDITANLDTDLMPWFNFVFHPSVEQRVLFGHWAALGLVQHERYLALDTGCVWGRKLSTVNLDNEEIIQVTAQQHMLVR